MKSRGQHEPRRRARRRALQALYQWQITRQDVNEIIGQFLDEQDFSGVDMEHFQLLVKGVAGSHERLDEQIVPHLDRPIEQLDVMETVILRIAAFEMLNHPEIPCRVVLDEAIDLARRFGAEQGHAFVNGVLDKAARLWRELEMTGKPVKPA